MSEIAGSSAILIASELLATHKTRTRDPAGRAVRISPAEILILGAGVVGEFAARAAWALELQSRYMITMYINYQDYKIISAPASTPR